MIEIYLTIGFLISSTVLSWMIIEDEDNIIDDNQLAKDNLHMALLFIIFWLPIAIGLTIRSYKSKGEQSDKDN